MAGDAMDRSTGWVALIRANGGTLAARRALLAEKPVREALRLYRLALRKPIFSPHPRGGTDRDFPELHRFRTLGRLQLVEQQVLLADGKVPDALERLRSGFRFADALQSGAFQPGQVGDSILALFTRTVGEHLGQLSAQDCDTLYAICSEALKRPDGCVRQVDHAWRANRDALRQAQSAARTGNTGALERVLNPAGDPEVAKTLQAAVRQPAMLDRLVAAQQSRIDSHYAELRAVFRQPPWRRTFPQTPPGVGLLTPELRLLVPHWEQVHESGLRSRTHVQLLAVHAVIRRYLWEHDRLPAGLEELQLGELAIDLFSGQPLRYERVDEGYRLWSVGSEAPPGDERAVEGRRPVSIIPGEF